jgi:hypothetical protein
LFVRTAKIGLFFALRLMEIGNFAFLN